MVPPRESKTKLPERQKKAEVDATDAVSEPCLVFLLVSGDAVVCCFLSGE